MAYTDPSMMNGALSALGSSYRTPVSSQGAINFAQQAGAQREAESAYKQQHGQDKLWGLVNTAANLYTGGAFGAVTGGVGKKEGGGLGFGNLGGGGGGVSQAGLLNAASGILSRSGGGAGGIGNAAGATPAGGGQGMGWTPDNSLTFANNRMMNNPY